MIDLSLTEVAGIVNGTVHDADAERRVTGPAFLDSRVPEQGGLFVAVAGERADGHDHAPGAVEGGAAAVLGSRPTGVPTVVVPDPQKALQDLAAEVLRRLRAEGMISVVGLTGSAGKTSAKDLLAQVLAARSATVATHGSFNNEWGLPLTVLRADLETRFLILEMGARGIGHIRALCEIAPPDIALVLNVGTAHLGEFGSRDAIAVAKGELVEALGDHGVAVLNADDELVMSMAGRTKAPARTFGQAESADVRLAEVELDDLGRPGFTLTAGGAMADVQLRLVGAHMAHNATAAATVALALGLSLDEIADALESVESLSPWRMELSELRDDIVLVNDAYNANPESMRAAIDATVEIARARGGRSIVVLGEMRELGEGSETAHRELGAYAAARGVSHIHGVGPLAEAIGSGANGATTATSSADRAEALASLRQQLRPRDVVLVKASRGDRLELLAQSIIEEVGR